MHSKRSREPEESIGARVMFEFGVMFAILLTIALACDLVLRIFGAG
jgi:hypothetical protein